jgi:hypothetical protein
MDWSKGYSASYYIARVDPVTWKDIGRVEITGGSVKREPSALRESADLECIGYETGIEQWVRVYLDARQSGDATHTALFTGIASTPEVNSKGRYAETKLECYSVLKPVDDILLPRGWYASAGQQGAEVVGKLLKATSAPVVIAEDSPRLTESIIAEDGETNLTMVDRILTAINWRLRIDGDGTINVVPKPIESTVMFDPIDNDCIEPDVDIEADLYAGPNVYMAVADDISGVARDDGNGPLSVRGRGREIWAYETGVELAQNESIGQYAMRKLREAQTVAQAVSYARRYHPDVRPTDLIRLHYPEQELSGLYEVEAQSIDLGYNARTSEEVSARLDVKVLEDVNGNVGIIQLVTHDGINFVDSDGNVIVALTTY